MTLLPLPTGAQLAPRRSAATDPGRPGRSRPGARRDGRAIVAKGEAVYGINTGFGKLATVRIADADLETLQRNLVLSHAAGVGEPVPAGDRAADDGAEARRAWPRRFRRPARDARQLLHGMLTGDVIPVIPAQGSVGASGDLAPLAHLAAAMIGDRRRLLRRRAHARGDALGRAGLEPLVLGPKEGLALLNGTQFSTAHALARAVRGRARLPVGARSPARCRPTPPAAPTRPFDARIQIAARPSRTDRCRRRAARADGRAAPSAPRIASATTACRTLLPALPAAGDGRRARPDAAGGGDARDRGERRLRQSADLRRHRRGAFPAAISTPSRSRSPPTCWRSPSARSARSPSAASRCWSIRPCPACRRSSPRSRG